MNSMICIPQPGVLFSGSVGYLIGGLNGLAIGVIVWSVLYISVRVYKEVFK